MTMVIYIYCFRRSYDCCKKERKRNKIKYQRQFMF